MTARMRSTWPKTRRGVSILLAVVVIAIAIGGGCWYDRHWPWHHFRTVAAGRFYRAGQPAAVDVRTAVHDYGIKTIVNLRLDTERLQKGNWYAEEVRATAEAGAMHVDIPLACSTPPSPAQVDQLLALFDDPSRLPVLVHCEFGSVRSAAVEGLFRIEEMGESNAQALARVETWGHDFAKKDPLIHAFLRDYVPRRARPVAPGAQH